MADSLSRADCDKNKYVFHELVMTIVDGDEARQLFLLHRACVAGYPETVQHLLQTKWFDVNMADSDGCTALHVATSVGNADAVGQLLDAGAYVGCGTNRLVTPLHIVCSSNARRVVRMKFEQRGYHVTPQGRMFNDRMDVDVACLLIDAGADDLVEDIDGWTPADMARSSPNRALTKVMQVSADARRADRRLMLGMALNAPAVGFGLSSIDREIMMMVIKHGIGS
ncbi:ankyrin repeat-containing domain protein [Baffinella frigidus]|nr:ankyrin repeat-containing domain protein [Cryptophyta sp. CCMP2293]